MQYRRTKCEGGTYFFTVNLVNRNSQLLIEHIDVLKRAFIKVKQNHPFDIDAIVVLPDHLHTIWTLPRHDADYPKRWMLVKSGFSRQIPNTEHRCQSRVNKGERGIWQRRYWEHLVRDNEDYESHVNYIHYNPVKHGYVNNPSDWKYSSIHQFINKKIIEPNWASISAFNESLFGEI